MRQRRVLAVHDISCVGRCSLTVALPIISSVGVECSVLPTAVLSTHTGGFTGFTFRDLTDDIRPIGAHWDSEGIGFDAVYTGFLGSFEQIELVEKLVSPLSESGARIYVDPVMGDKGKLYSVFGPDFPAGMRRLCEKADLVMPNLTELALMLGFPYEDGPYSAGYVEDVLEKARVLGARQIVVTGVSFEEGQVGAVFKDYSTGESGSVMRREIPGYYHGTGDVFGSALVGAMESGLGLQDSVKAAVDFTVGSIARTYAARTDVRFGVNFECGILGYASEVRSMSRMRRASCEEDVKSIARMAAAIWPEVYVGMIPDGQTEYMVERFQSEEAVRSQISDGYVYDIARDHGDDVGYSSYRIDGDLLFLSKLYVSGGSRGEGYGKMLLDAAVDAGRAAGAKRVELTVNRNNSKAIGFYGRMGLSKVRDQVTDIGGGYVMDDYRMGMDI